MTTATVSISDIMRSAWVSARAGAARFGGRARDYLGLSLVASWAAARRPAAPVREEVWTGRNVIRASLRYSSDVVGGGAVTPWVRVATGYDTDSFARYDADCRSGSKRSGSLVWQLEEDKLYEIHAAENSSRSCRTFVSTFDGVTLALSRSQFEAERRRRWPAGFELAKVRAEQARVEQEARDARRVVEERERLERMRVEAERREAEVAARKAALASEADKLETEGQAREGDLPLLKGTPKQVAWALRIRAAVQRQEPNNAALRRATKAGYWIDNYRTALGGF